MTTAPSTLASRAFTADKVINQLTEFGEACFRLGALARITETEFRLIASTVTGETIEIDGESVPLTPENAPRIREAVRVLRTQLSHAQRLPRSGAASELLARLDALLYDVKRLDQPVLPELERASLRGLAHYAVKKWSILRAFDQAA
jgi:hypothetical protein